MKKSIEDNVWSDPKLKVKKMNYKEIKELLINKAKNYEVFINPRILGISTLHQYAYEFCPSFPRYKYIILA